MKKSRFTDSQIMDSLKRVVAGLACHAFLVGESCYRYECKHNAENEEIAN
jgi:hypothetical protein